MFDYNFVLRGISVTMIQYMIAYLLGAILAYIVNRNQRTLSRSPFLFLYGLNSLFFTIFSYVLISFLCKIDVKPSQLIGIIEIIPVFIYSFIAMYLAICRGRDGFGEKSASILQFIPFLCLILYFVRLQSNNSGPIVRNPVPTPKLINGGIGFLLAVIILFVNLLVNAQIFRAIPVRWVMF